MIWKVFRRLKSSSETRVTAEKAVVEGLPLSRPKAVGRGWVVTEVGGLAVQVGATSAL